MIVHRISKGTYKNDLSGTGAEIYGGRWNNKGNKMLYTSSSIALAMAEVAVHVPFGILPKDYFLISIEAPDVQISVVNGGEISGYDWNSHPVNHITQEIGDKFLKQNKFLCLKVPSVVVPGDYNFLFNPLHEDFNKVKVIDIKPFQFDKRIFPGL